MLEGNKGASLCEFVSHVHIEVVCKQAVGYYTAL